MKVLAGLIQLCSVGAFGWLLAQGVLLLFFNGVPATRLDVALAPPVIPLLDGHWRLEGGIGPALVAGDRLPNTQLPLRWLGQLRASDESPQAASGNSLVVLGFGDQQKVLGVGDQLAPGIRVERIDEQGVVIDNQGRRERLRWPEQSPVNGVRSLDG
ncbi:MAG: pilus assembly protein PilZ [Oceanospirillaceae bacterium]|nr:pilus assembly protein PilZ [Oceanospirillaceae bacterium]